MSRYFFTSLTRISNLRDVPFTVQPLAREKWRTGDYVVGQVNARPNPVTRIEVSTGRVIEVMEGSLVVGAFGDRRATLEAVGSWKDIEDDMQMEVIGGGGLIGRLTSKSPYTQRMLSVLYKGHVLVDGQPRNMLDYVVAVEEQPFDLPVVLIIGTSMDAGKTTAARMIIRELKDMGLRVIGAKLTGSGRYRDILSMRDAGADVILDFVDVGLPTTVCPVATYEKALRQLLARMMLQDADVAVVEAGASPLEPYNGETAVAMIEDQVRFTVLCASDPYAVSGIIHAYGNKPNIVSGAAANTQAAIDLVHKLTGLTAVNLLDQESLWRVRDMLQASLNVETIRANAAVG